MLKHYRISVGALVLALSLPATLVQADSRPVPGGAVSPKIDERTTEPWSDLTRTTLGLIFMAIHLGGIAAFENTLNYHRAEAQRARAERSLLTGVQFAVTTNPAAPLSEGQRAAYATSSVLVFQDMTRRISSHKRIVANQNPYYLGLNWFGIIWLSLLTDDNRMVLGAPPESTAQPVIVSLGLPSGGADDAYSLQVRFSF